MGLLRKLFGKHDSVTESVINGVAVGYAIGDKLDERRDRQTALELLSALVDQNNALHIERDQKERERALRQLHRLQLADVIRRVKWPWRLSDECHDLQVDAILRSRNPDFKAEDRKLYARWTVLFTRALKAGINPLIHMPRSISGDVIGTPKLLVQCMDKLEARVRKWEGASRIDSKWSE